MWLKFKKGLKGSRPVRLLNSGIITTGNAKLPVRPYEGSLEVYDANSKCGDMWSPPEAMAAIPPARHPQPEEGVSYTMVNRGDKIRTCDLLVPNQAL